MENYDVLIIGGGTSGAIAAFILQNSGFNCVIADDVSQFKSFKIGESLISSAKPILEKTGLMPWVMKSFPHENYGNLSAWGSHQLVFRDFIFSPHGSGWHLDRALFDQCLRDAAKYAGVNFKNGYVKTITKSGEFWIAKSKHSTIKARWVIDASGRHAFMSKQLDIPRYVETPLIAIYSLADNLVKETRTLVETAPYGWWYTASIPGDRRVAALHIRPSDISKLLKKETDWLNLISNTNYISTFCSPKQNWARTQGADAAGAWQKNVSGENWIAIGDAAIAFDPVSSQGIFNAVYTAWKATSLIRSDFLCKDATHNSYDNEIRNINLAYKYSEYEYYRSEKRWKNYNFWREFNI